MMSIWDCNTNFFLINFLEKDLSKTKCDDIQTVHNNKLWHSLERNKKYSTPISEKPQSFPSTLNNDFHKLRNKNFRPTPSNLSIFLPPTPSPSTNEHRSRPTDYFKFFSFWHFFDGRPSVGTPISFSFIHTVHFFSIFCLGFHLFRLSLYRNTCIGKLSWNEVINMSW